MIKETLKLLSKTQKQGFVIVIGLSIFIKILPFTNYISQRISLMFHELGHAVTAWSFGHFAVPRFDYLNGGGVTDIFPRSIFFSIFIFAFIGVNYFYIKKYSNAYSLKKWWIFVVIYILLFFTEGYNWLISFMGKGGELLFCYLIAWYSLSLLKTKINTKAVAYLLVSVLLWINSVQDTLKLILDDEEIAKYHHGIIQTLGGEPMKNDLVRLVESTGFHFEFFNNMLLIIAGIVLFKIIKSTNTPAYSKARFYNYLQNFIQIMAAQAKVIKNKPIKTNKNKNTDLKK